MPGLGDSGLRPGPHGEGAEHPHTHIGSHQLGRDAAQRRGVEGVSEIIVDLVRPHTEVRVLVEYRRARVEGHLTVKSSVDSDVFGSNVE